MVRKLGNVVVVILAQGACSGVPGANQPVPVPVSAMLPPPPWSRPSLAAAAVPPVYLRVWRDADNRATCALLAPAQLDAAVPADAVPRAASFSGGWAVAYDVTGMRGAFGVAGTGSTAWGAGVYDEWPEKRAYADSSRAGYGLEGGTGPNWLAYVRIPGQECLYNVWSRRGQAHLEALLQQLRFVDVP